MQYKLLKFCKNGAPQKNCLRLRYSNSRYSFIRCSKIMILKFQNPSSIGRTQESSCMGFEKEILQEGSGPTPTKGKNVTVHCTGNLIVILLTFTMSR